MIHKLLEDMEAKAERFTDKEMGKALARKDTARRLLAMMGIVFVVGFGLGAIIMSATNG